ncbi:winged helix DNA-binding protein [Nocardioides nanhaiensis]|uniref:HTH marR-type domain-containing protein n=1 Tax=Nocardioides nanhaiensis TaxID=1476871 RepID=A0ABP8WGE3_9ACTN
MRDLAAELDTSQPTITDALATLRRKNLVAEAPDPAERRHAFFSLTDDGRDLCDRLLHWDRSVTATMTRIDPALKGTACASCSASSLIIRLPGSSTSLERV